MIISTNESIAAVGARVLAVRQTLGLSQQRFADALCISLRAAQNYERGERKMPAEVLMAVARKFDIDPFWIMYGPEERPRTLGRVGLDKEALSRAIAVVQMALTETSASVRPEQFASIVAAVYKFYILNTSGAGVEELVSSLVARA